MQGVGGRVGWGRRDGLRTAHAGVGRAVFGADVADVNLRHGTYSHGPAGCSRVC